MRVRIRGYRAPALPATTRSCRQWTPATRTFGASRVRCLPLGGLKHQRATAARDAHSPADVDGSLAVPVSAETLHVSKLRAGGGHAVPAQPRDDPALPHRRRIGGQGGAIRSRRHLRQLREQGLVGRDPASCAGERGSGIAAHDLRERREDLLADGDAAECRVVIRRAVRAAASTLTPGAASTVTATTSAVTPSSSAAPAARCATSADLSCRPWSITTARTSFPSAAAAATRARESGPPDSPMRAGAEGASTSEKMRRHPGPERLLPAHG